MKSTILATLVAVAAGLAGINAHAAGDAARTPEQRAEAKAKWDAMTPEQKAAAKEQMKARYAAMTPEEKQQFAKDHPRAAERIANKHDGAAK